MSSKKSQHLPQNCEHIVQRVAKLFRRSEGAVLPLCSSDQQLRISSLQPPKIALAAAAANGAAGDGKKSMLSTNGGRPLTSSSSSSLLRVSGPAAGGGGGVGPGGKRLLSLDSAAAQLAAPAGGGGGHEEEWLRTQRKLVAEAAELRRQREQAAVCCASVGASYAFLALSVALSLSVVIAVCLFLHSFVPKEYYYQNASSPPSHANNFIGTTGNTEPFLLATNLPQLPPQIAAQFVGQNDNDDAAGNAIVTAQF
ncbi:hypothetical protein GPALN_011648 [Globodera pallida]|nr:hypothetical protein GPALN_011648 [Globodera pallida]